MKLVNDRETKDVVYELAEEPKPIFTIRKLSYADVSQINDGNSYIDETGNIILKGGTAGRLKLKLGLVGWKNMFDASGEKEVPCTDANKEKLPIDVIRWIIFEIDNLNKLSGVPEDERKN